MSLIDRRVLQKNDRGVGGRFLERLKQRKKNIPAPKAVMLNDGKIRRGGGQPMSRGGRRGAINHYRDEPDVLEVQGKGLAPPAGEDRQSREWCQDARAQLGEAAWGLGRPQGDSTRMGE